MNHVIKEEKTPKNTEKIKLNDQSLNSSSLNFNQSIMHLKEEIKEDKIMDKMSYNKPYHSRVRSTGSELSSFNN